MTREYDKIKLDAMSLDVGENSYKETCPFCGVGGGSFSISREDDGILFHCFRASCGEGGFIPSNFYSGATRAKQKHSPTFDEETIFLNDKQLAFFNRKYGLSASELGSNQWKFVPAMGAVAMPILDKYGLPKGTTIRYYTELGWDGVGSKAKNYLNGDNSRLHYPADWMRTHKSRVVLVEDMVSAIKVSRYTPCIALLGTNFNYDMMREIMDITYSVRFALDGDAFSKASEYVKKYSLFFREIDAVWLKQDPKDMDDELILKTIV